MFKCVQMSKQCYLNVFEICSYHACAHLVIFYHICFRLSHSLYLLQKRIYTIIFPCGDRNIQNSPDSPTRLVSWHENRGISQSCCFFSSVRLNNIHHFHFERQCAILIRIYFLWQIETRTKWPTFCKQHFQNYLWNTHLSTGGHVCSKRQ